MICFQKAQSFFSLSLIKTTYLNKSLDGLLCQILRCFSRGFLGQLLFKTSNLRFISLALSNSFFSNLVEVLVHVISS